MSDADPETLAREGLQTALAKLEKAAEADGALETGRLEDAAVSAVVEGVAEAFAAGLNQPAGRYAAPVADQSAYYTKSDIKQKIADEAERVKLASGDKRALDKYLDDSLETVIIHQSTDAKQSARYTFDFGGFKVQTESGKDGRGHYNWPNFRDYIYEAGGPNLAKPSKERRSGDDWRDFILQLVEERGETRRIPGPRTDAVSDLQRKVRRQTGYGTAVGALEYTGIWVVKETTDVPGWWAGLARSPAETRDLAAETVGEVRVLGDVVQKVTENAGITRDALYQELDARGHTVPGSGGPSMVEWIDGSEERFWTLLPSIGTPRTYVPDPHAEIVESGPLLGESGESDGETEPATDTDGFKGVGEIA